MHIFLCQILLILLIILRKPHRIILVTIYSIIPFLPLHFRESVPVDGLCLSATRWGLTRCDPRDWQKNHHGRFYSYFPLRLSIRNRSSSLQGV